MRSKITNKYLNWCLFGACSLYQTRNSVSENHPSLVTDFGRAHREGLMVNF